jgi:hypothetical protein
MDLVVAGRGGGHRYVLITDARCGHDGGLPRVFLHHEGLARFCTTPYAEPAADNLADNTRHLSNYSVRCRLLLLRFPLLAFVACNDARRDSLARVPFLFRRAAFSPVPLLLDLRPYHPISQSAFNWALCSSRLTIRIPELTTSDGGRSTSGRQSTSRVVQCRKTFERWLRRVRLAGG